MSLRLKGLEKPKRKRGRPKKVKNDTESEPQELISSSIKNECLKEQEEESEYDENGRKRRRRKVPVRFMEAVQGKELDRILREEGAIDGNESDEAPDEEQTTSKSKNDVKEEIGEEAPGGTLID